jgi:hypothetical protein
MRTTSGIGGKPSEAGDDVSNLGEDQIKEMSSNIFTLILLILTISCQGQDTLQSSRTKKWSFFSADPDTTKKHRFELSFGQNLLFISNSQQENILKDQSVVLPTSAILFFSEFRPTKAMRIPVFLNIATESKQFLIDGVLLNEKASPTFGTGLTFKTFGYQFEKETSVEVELGPLVSCIVNNSNNLRIAPVLASRLKICRGTNFVMYIGVNYSLGIDSFGIMYGTGTVF